MANGVNQGLGTIQERHRDTDWRAVGQSGEQVPRDGQDLYMTPSGHPEQQDHIGVLTR
jgi:hypothetical protein